MSIEVTCTCGKKLKVKDKYAGKTGKCPYCEALVDVPEQKISEDDIVDLIGPPIAVDADHTVEYPTDDDDEQSALAGHEPAHESGMSLLGSGVVKRQKTCPNCGHFSPHWHATCASCNQFFPPE